MVAVHDLLGSHAFLLGPDGDGRAVGVAARYHQHLVALQPVVASEDVGGEIAPG